MKLLLALKTLIGRTLFDFDVNNAQNSPLHIAAEKGFTQCTKVRSTLIGGYREMQIEKGRQRGKVGEREREREKETKGDRKGGERSRGIERERQRETDRERENSILEL